MRALQSQGHLGKRRDTDAVTGHDREEGLVGEKKGEGELATGREKKMDNVKYFLLSTPLPGTCIDFCMWKISVFDKVG